jgi:putative tricarboxylic transport membrane protein
MELDYTFIVIGSLAGVIGGMMPGVGMTVMMISAYPLLVSLEVEQIFQLYISAILVSQFAGSIVATYFAIPGEMSSVPAIIEGHGMAKQGKANQAIFISAFGSFVGGIVTLLILLLFGGLLLKAFLHFNTVFNVFLVSLVFVFLFLLPTKNKMEKFLFPLAGFVLGLIGTTPHDNHNSWLTFGIRDLEAGIPLMGLMIGLYSLPLLTILHKNRIKETIKITAFKFNQISIKLYQFGLSIFYAVYGFLLAFVPGVGLDVVSNTAHKMQEAVNKKFKFPNRMENNLLAAETANNSGALSIMLPLLAFGLPTNTSQAILNNILTDKNYLFGVLSFNQSFIDMLLGIVIITSFLGFLLAGPLASLLGLFFRKTEKFIYVALGIILVLVTLYTGHNSLNLPVYLLTLLITFIIGMYLRNYNVLRIIYFFMVTPFFVENWLRLAFILDIL